VFKVDERLCQFVDAVPCGVLVVDRAGKIELVNTLAERMFGYRRQELIGQTVERLIPRHSRDQHTAYREGFVTNPEARHMGIGRDLAGIRKDGSEFPLEIGLSRIEGEGDVRVLATLVDITQRKRIERALHQEKERLKVTLHSIGDGVITTDAAGRIESMNPIAEMLTGWLLDKARGEPLEKVFQIVSEHTQDTAPNPVTQCLEEKRTVRLGNHTLLLSRDGQRYAVQVSAAPIRAVGGEILGAVLVFQDVTEARGLARQVEHQARHDTLTGLLNRREFKARLERALASAQREGKHHVLCYLDLDNFKIVNDTAGHAAGDTLLKQIAHVLAGKVRARDSLGRLGGDEFSLLLEGCPLDRARKIAEDLVATIHSLRFSWDEQVYAIGVSIGLVPVTHEAESTAQVLTRADVACYAAKDQGRNRVVAYHTDDGDSAHRHREMLRAASLRDALEKDRFCLYAQPIAALATDVDDTLHYELLLRLRSEAGELLPPGAFIPAAERYHLMGAIDRWVIETALQRYADLFDADTPVRISLNLSGNSLTDERLLAFVQEQLLSTAIPSDRICFEITETAAIRNVAQATQFITALKDTGCRFALDDFGSGLCSFNYLKQFPVDYLKIDGSFVKGVVDDAIDRAMVDSINHIGHVMGIQTIAEWAENEQIVDQLRAIGVDYVQGYAVGYPQPFAALGSS
jgi:diguanylate cyclase (GGDEF)-like protein/PAS domain S-box-containing protein